MKKFTYQEVKVKAAEIMARVRAGDKKIIGAIVAILSLFLFVMVAMVSGPSGQKPVKATDFGSAKTIQAPVTSAPIVQSPQITVAPSGNNGVAAPATPVGDTNASYSSTFSYKMHDLHKVVEGDFLRKIADKHKVSWEAVLLLNEDFLKKNYEKVCTKMGDKYRNNAHRSGVFCNDRYNRAYGNTLMPGWQLKIPATTAPATINQAVSQIQGKRVALVIDDTGSLGNDRQLVSEWYLAAFRTHNKNIIGVWLYADGQVRHYTDSAGVQLKTMGNFENTHGALRVAAVEKPDSIILVTDEPGDDWMWPAVRNLPPVVAHCLPDRATISCEPNLRRLAVETHGQYMSGLK